MATFDPYFVNNYLYYQLVVEESSVDQINNTSTVSWYVQVGRSNTGYKSEYTWSYSVNIGGKTASGSQYCTVTHDPVTIGYGSFTIEHNSDGSGSVACSASISSSRGSGDVGGTITLTTIPRASSISAPSFTLGQAGTITIIPAASGFTHTIRWYYGGTSGTVIEKTTGTSVSWTPDITLAQYTTYATSGAGTLRCVTYSGNTEIGTKDITLYCTVPSSLVPTLSDITITPVNENEIVSGWGLYVKGLTKVKVVADASGVQGSDIVSVWYSITGLGAKKATLTFESAQLVSIGEVAVEAQAVDSRGRTSNVLRKTINVLDYVKPTLSGMELFRCDETGNADDTGQYIYAKATANYSDVGGNNTYTLAVQYQKTDGSSTSSVTLESGVGQIIGDGKISYAVSYKATITLQDTMTNSATYTVTIPSDHVSFNLRPGGNGGSFGSYAEKDDVLNVEWDLNVKQNIAANGYLLGETALDPVIASGASGIWNYVKFSSGLAICTARRTQGGVNVGSTWGNIYATAGNIITPISYPFAFTSVPMECVAITTGSAKMSAGIITGETTNTTTTTGAYDLIRGTQAWWDGYIQYVVMGWWK